MPFCMEGYPEESVDQNRRILLHRARAAYPAGAGGRRSRRAVATTLQSIHGVEEWCSKSWSSVPECCQHWRILDRKIFRQKISRARWDRRALPQGEDPGQSKLIGKSNQSGKILFVL